ncbi:MAG: hypothetical protein FWB99_04025 [Treponema sp.]|nr:hypothetical protein [Treponema sp.]
MKKLFFCFEQNGENALGFDTGLDAKAFAKAKMAQFISIPGFIVYPDGKVEAWHLEGVTERETMLLWGPFFPGECLDDILNDSSRQNEALNALRFWLRSHQALKTVSAEKKEPPFPGPAGAYIVTERQAGTFPAGTVLFPPARLLKRYLELDGERWIHPDLDGAEAISFSAAAMLYRVFCGDAPFTKDTLEELRQDIREGVFTPPALAAPGLDLQMADIITRAMSQSKDGKVRPAPAAVSECLGTTQPVSSWMKPLNEEERLRIQAEQEQYISKKTRAVKTRRFMVRNTVLLAGAAIAVVLIFFSILGINRHIAEQPSTRGMSAGEVVQAYYAAFSSLDPLMMRACLLGRAGRRDIDLVSNLFAVSRIRQAFEIDLGQAIFFPAQEWLDAGQPVTERIVFGITELSIRMISQDETNAVFEAEYLLWMPGTFFLEDGETPPLDELPPPGSLTLMDRLYLAVHRGTWRITEIYRTGN